MRRNVMGQAMIEYLLVSLLVVLGLFVNLVPPGDTGPDTAPSEHRSVAHAFVAATHDNITAWHFGTRLAD